MPEVSNADCRSHRRNVCELGERRGLCTTHPRLDGRCEWRSRVRRPAWI